MTIPADVDRVVAALPGGRIDLLANVAGIMDFLLPLTDLDDATAIPVGLGELLRTPAASKVCDLTPDNAQVGGWLSNGTHTLRGGRGSSCRWDCDRAWCRVPGRSACQDFLVAGTMVA